jgi:uncharacterized protein YecE (DUF72 family)
MKPAPVAVRRGKLVIQIGMSGWVYKHWIGCFYPHDLKQKDWLPHYADRFDTVEINRSFYRLPTRENFERWAEQVGWKPNFTFAVKASRYTTHLKRLREPEDSLRRLFEAAQGLEGHLGPFLYQMPPRFPADIERLRYFLQQLPREHRHALEFRDHSWFSPEVLGLLDDHGCALVRAIGGWHTPMEVPDAGPFRYLRVHGGQFGIGLTEGELQFWADRVREYLSQGLDVYLYFNNDPECQAIYNGYRMREILGV